jgi:hypothetical protein
MPDEETLDLDPRAMLAFLSSMMTLTGGHGWGFRAVTSGLLFPATELNAKAIRKMQLPEGR